MLPMSLVAFSATQRFPVGCGAVRSPGIESFKRRHDEVYKNQIIVFQTQNEEAPEPSDRF